MNIRMLPPAYSGPAQIVDGIRSYSGTPGTPVDVPTDDAVSLIGWTPIALSGPTSQRPKGAQIGTLYVDTTVNAMIVFTGTAAGWINPATGATV